MLRALGPHHPWRKSPWKHELCPLHRRLLRPCLGLLSQELGRFCGTSVENQFILFWHRSRSLIATLFILLEAEA